MQPDPLFSRVRAALVTLVLFLGAASAEEPRARMLFLVDDPANAATFDQIEALRAMAGTMGHEVVIRAHGSRTEIEQQILAAAIAEKVKGILAMPVHDKASVESFRIAREAGIPVVVVERPIEAGIVRGQFVLDDRRCATEAAALFAKMLDGRGGFLLVDGPPDDTVSQIRSDAILAALKAYPDLRHVGTVTGPARRDAIHQMVQSVIPGATPINGVITLDDEQALGVMSALAGMAGQEGMLLASIGGTTEAQDAVRGGAMAFTMLEPGTVMVEAAMTALDALLKGASPASPEIRSYACTAYSAEDATRRLTPF